MSIEQMEEKILDYLEGDLAHEEEQALLAEIEANAEYGALLEEYRQQDRQLETWFRASLGEMEKKARRPDLSGLPGVIMPVRRSRTERRKMAWTLSAVAAVLLVVVTTIPFVLNKDKGQQLGAVLSFEGRPQTLVEGHVVDLSNDFTFQKAVNRLKTPADSWISVALPDDGSRFEMNANSSVTLKPQSALPDLELDRGEVLVSAKSGNVKVVTPQIEVAGSDSVFSVVRGLRGSEVGVLSGSVELLHEGTRRQLAAGETFSSLGSRPEPIIRRVAWSPNRDQWIAAIPQQLTPTNTSATDTATPAGAPVPVKIIPAEVTASEAVSQPTVISNFSKDVAFGTKLLPADVFSVVEIRSIEELLAPLGASNFAELVTRENIHKVMESVIQSADVPKEQIETVAWRIENVLLSPDIRTLLESLNASFSFGITEHGPVMVADLGQRAPDVAEIVNYRLQPILTAFLDEDMRPWVAVENGFLLLARGRSDFEEMSSAAKSARAGGFGKSEFLGEIRDSIAGSPFYVVLNIEKMRDTLTEKVAGERGRAEVNTGLKRLGLANMKGLVASTGLGDQASNQALRLFFEDEREGLMSWIAEPGPLASLDLFSPDAHLVTAMKVRRPAEVLQEVLGWINSSSSKVAVPHTARQIDLFRNLSKTLGNEIAVGLENPLLPIPNVKVAIEVLDPDGFHDGMLALLDEIWLSGSPAARVTADTEEYRGHLIVDFQYPGVPFGLSYAIVNDFVVIGPGRAFVKNTIDIAIGGRSLSTQHAFQESLPARSGSHVSWLTYLSVDQDVAQAIETLNSMLPSETPMNFTQLKNMGGGKATVAYAIAHEKTIDFFVEGVRVGDFEMTTAIPVVANWLQQKPGAFQ